MLVTRPAFRQNCAGRLHKIRGGMKTICLVMIVKNEAAIIRRCLESVKSIIHDWVICDTGSTANFITSLPHGFSVGQAVQILDASPSPYNGIFVITSVPSPTRFTYLMTSDPGSDASGSFTFAALWQVGRLVIENNIIELVLNPAPYGQGYASGILVDGGSPVSPYVFGQAVIRGNLIRNVDGAFEPLGTAIGIRLSSCLGAILENNIISLNSSSQIPPYNISHSACGSAKYFNNQTPNGKLIQGYNAATAQSVNELTTDAELALLWSS